MSKRAAPLLEMEDRVKRRNFSMNFTWIDRVSKPARKVIAKRIAQDCDWSWIEETNFTKQQVEEYQIFLLCKVIAEDVVRDPGNQRFMLSDCRDR